MQSIFEVSQNYEEEDTESNSFLDENYVIRVQTAPARPITELEEFKRYFIQSLNVTVIRSTEFLLLEQAFICQNHLIQKDFQKYDLDSVEGQRICKKYLNIIEKLCDAYSADVASRNYRNEFSRAYKILYKQDKLCYLTEILDSAQEGFPYLWVNGQKYVFSQQVLEAGAQLIEAFYRVQHVIRHAYSRVVQEPPDFQTDTLKKEISAILEQFDAIWVQFEKVKNNILYVIQLMFIESEARKQITIAIEIDKELTSLEIREKMRGKILVVSEDVINLKKKLCRILAEINAVANTEGKGRDDLGPEILIESEGIIRRVTKEQSRAVRGLAETIKKTFQQFRDLLKKYDENIEMVDPQLKNNGDLVEILSNYEVMWEKGANYFLNPHKCSQLQLFSHIIETTGEKYKYFQDQIDDRDAEIFVSIPQVLILKNLEKEDKNICAYFLPSILEQGSKQNKLYLDLQKEFLDWRSSHTKSYEYHNILEKMLLSIELSEEERTSAKEFGVKLDAIVQKIKLLSIELQRHNAHEWNQFIDAALNNNY